MISYTVPVLRNLPTHTPRDVSEGHIASSVAHRNLRQGGAARTPNLASSPSTPYLPPLRDAAAAGSRRSGAGVTAVDEKRAFARRRCNERKWPRS